MTCKIMYLSHLQNLRAFHALAVPDGPGSTVSKEGSLNLYLSAM